jgi:leukotriene-A4 hydrolase
VITQLDLSDWIYGVDLPNDAPRADSTRIFELVKVATEFATTKEVVPEDTQSWSPQEWQIFLSQLSGTGSMELCSILDSRFGLTKTENLEIRVAFLILAINHGYEPAFHAAATILKQVGRMKYLRPLYTALSKHSEQTYQIAAEAFSSSRASYHPVACSLVENLLKKD